MEIFNHNSIDYTDRRVYNMLQIRHRHVKFCSLDITTQ